MIISFCGNAGAGKTTAAKQLAKDLGWPHYYIGGLRRQKAKERGLTLEEYNQLGETDPKTDLEVDEYQRELATKEDNFIIEGRTSWYFIPTSFKIFMDVNEEIGAERILKNLQMPNDRNETNKVVNQIKEMQSLNLARKTSDTLRYKQYYNIDVYDKSNFDYVLDTSDLTPDQSYDLIWEKVQKILTKA
ncbi:MAG: cytidylate kinase family protein [bacterium]